MFLKKVKKSFDDYVAYFRQGSLSDKEISAILGVSRVNVWRMRQKWKSGEIPDNKDSRVTISEDTFEHLWHKLLNHKLKLKKLKAN